MVNGQDSTLTSQSRYSSAKPRDSIIFPSLLDPPPKFIRNFNSRSNQFSKLDNKYAHKSCGEFLGCKGHGLKRQTGGALLHKSENIIAWATSAQPDSYISRNQSTYTAPGLVRTAAGEVPPGEVPTHSQRRRYRRVAVPPTSEYKLSTTTSCWQPDPNFRTMYKVLAETQHRLVRPNTWKYSTHPDYKLADLNRMK